MGPEATAQLYKEVISECQRQYGARYDSDYPEIIIYNLPLPNVVDNVGSRKGIIEKLSYGLRKLEAAGADFVAIPCNTVNVFYSKMCSSVSIPVYSIIEETSKIIYAAKLNKVGVLGTELTIKARLYETALKRYGVATVNPTRKDCKAVTSVIMNILKGEKNADDICRLLEIIKKLKLLGAEAIVLGCTELPLLLNGDAANSAKLPLIDNLKVLAQSSVRAAYIGRSGVVAACKLVELKGRVRFPTMALTITLSENHHCCCC